MWSKCRCQGRKDDVSEGRRLELVVEGNYQVGYPIDVFFFIFFHFFHPFT